jgi:hypothetical protein
MESQKVIDDLTRLGEANAGDPNDINEEVYWKSFRDAWDSGLQAGLQEGRVKAMSDLNIHTVNIE